MPDWAKEFDAQTWAQFFLKFVVSHPAITVTTPATSQAKNMIDNIGGGIGRLPDRGDAQADGRLRRRAARRRGQRPRHEPGRRHVAAWTRWLQRLVDVRPRELAAVGWSWLFFFAVLSAYYVIRPIRDDMGVAGGVENLPWLFTGSLTGMLLANPPFAYLVARMPRARFVSWGYRFFALNLVAFFAAAAWGRPRASRCGSAAAFFIWTSIFNMFVVSIFWSVMADVFSPAQSKRLFGFIGAGGTHRRHHRRRAHQLARRADRRGQPAAGVGGAARSGGAGGSAAVRACRARPRPRKTARPPRRQVPERAIGGSMWEGMRRALADPYLLNVTLNMLFFTVLTTFLYFQQATIVDAALTDRAERTRFFANIDLAVNATELVDADVRHRPRR